MEFSSAGLGAPEPCPSLPGGVPGVCQCQGCARGVPVPRVCQCRPPSITFPCTHTHPSSAGLLCSHPWERRAGGSSRMSPGARGSPCDPQRAAESFPSPSAGTDCLHGSKSLLQDWATSSPSSGAQRLWQGFELGSRFGGTLPKTAALPCVLLSDLPALGSSLSKQPPVPSAAQGERHLSPNSSHLLTCPGLGTCGCSQPCLACWPAA